MHFTPPTMNVCMSSSFHNGKQYAILTPDARMMMNVCNCKVPF